VVTPEQARDNKVTATDLTDFDVEATDGHIGKVDEATYETSGSYLVVDTGFWIFGKKRMIPASVVERVDTTERKAYLRITKDQVKDAPDFDSERDLTDQRPHLDDYYGATAGRRK
jgi:hypothetical protein